MNDHESAAMWKLYSFSNEAIAVRSTYQRLRAALPPEAAIGAVRYVDYSSDHIPEGHVLSPFIYKRRSFEYEQELRAVIREDPPIENEVCRVDAENPRTGFTVPATLSDLIERVYIAPTAPAWFADLVTQITAKYGLGAEVIRSDIDGQPVY
jgi:hypothetical protein